MMNLCTKINAYRLFLGLLIKLQILFPKGIEELIREGKMKSIYFRREYANNNKLIMRGRIWIQKHRISLFKRPYVFY